jgi:hypothetical protein
MLNRIFKLVILVFFPLLIITSVSSCKKAEDTIARIIVKDSNGVLVSDAYVVLYQDSLISPQGNQANHSALTKEDYTDDNGIAEFTYTLEAILNVGVSKTVGNNILTGAGKIRLRKEKIEEEIITIN